MSNEFLMQFLADREKKGLTGNLVSSTTATQSKKTQVKKNKKSAADDDDAAWNALEKEYNDLINLEKTSKKKVIEYLRNLIEYYEEKEDS